MATPPAGSICAYCSTREAVEEDHVVARQFFPNVLKYRDQLPKVPSCRICNQWKQQVEDGPAVLLQFGHASEASRRVLLERVRRTLRKNLRLGRALNRGLRWIWLRRHSGLVTREQAFELEDRELADLNDWFRLIIRGLYSYEVGAPLEAEHTVHLLRPAMPEQYAVLRRLIANHRSTYRSCGNGEFQYAFAAGNQDAVSAWLLAFKSVDMGAVTLPPDVPQLLRDSVAAVEWTKPDSNEVGSVISAPDG